MAGLASLLLDTHVWFWLVRGNAEKLKPELVARLEDAARLRPLLISVISVWEIALLASRSRIRLSVPVQDWVDAALARPEFALVGLEPRVAVESCHLPGDFHADPADRFLVATARANDAALVTSDLRILRYGEHGHVKVLPV